ncbi:MAG TPA: tRNA (guanosine(37)-N1)-methyltransferase TrmD [Syntrophales bacterium]|nr:tRNA (guanosine(37)-N1)-methyltransferase TrmD [Syntrophales bacterium]
MIRFDVLTIFPEMFHSPLRSSLIGKAREKGLIAVEIHDIREYATDRHRMTDDYPYGGGGGMVMKVEPIARALDDVLSNQETGVVVLLTPQGERLSQETAEEMARHGRIILICGHYEGVDERIREHLVDREISIGDYVLTGGELPALVLIDVLSRLVPDVLGNRESARQDSFSAGLLEHPQYTRPRSFRGWEVPDVLLSGNHREIENWRRRESLRRTALRKPELLERANLTDDERQALSRWLEEKNGKGDMS